jgi:hypothetical protein
MDRPSRLDVHDLSPGQNDDAAVTDLDTAKDGPH